VGLWGARADWLFGKNTKQEQRNVIIKRNAYELRIPFTYTGDPASRESRGSMGVGGGWGWSGQDGEDGEVGVDVLGVGGTEGKGAQRTAWLRR